MSSSAGDTRPAALLLADRTIEGGAAGLDDSPDLAGAAGRCALCALAVVDREGMLEIAERTVGAGIVPQRRAACQDGGGYHVANRFGEAVSHVPCLPACPAERTGFPQGRQMCPPQGFRGIDIAKPCNQPLVEQRDRKSTRLNSSHVKISYAVFC